MLAVRAGRMAHPPDPPHGLPLNMSESSGTPSANYVWGFPALPSRDVAENS